MRHPLYLSLRVAQGDSMWVDPPEIFKPKRRAVDRDKTVADREAAQDETGKIQSWLELAAALFEAKPRKKRRFFDGDDDPTPSAA